MWEKGIPSKGHKSQGHETDTHPTFGDRRETEGLEQGGPEGNKRCSHRATRDPVLCTHYEDSGIYSEQQGELH